MTLGSADVKSTWGIYAPKPQELFLRYYGDVFSPEQRKKILAAIPDYERRKEAAQDA